MTFYVETRKRILMPMCFLKILCLGMMLFTAKLNGGSKMQKNGVDISDSDRLAKILPEHDDDSKAKIEQPAKQH